MMEYKLIVSYGSSDFTGDVTQSMQEGWKPKGGVCYDGSDYHQAMIRNVPLPPVPLQRSSAVVGSSSSSSSDSDSGGSSRKKSKRRLRKTQYRSKRNNQKSKKSRKL
jgi:hypothetical protein